METAFSITGWRKCILHFTPSWFFLNMGTGLVSIVLHDCPYQFNGLRTIATIIFIFNIVLFLFILTATILRYTLFPFTLSLMFRHPGESLFVGTFPMGLSTVVYMLAQVAVIDHQQDWARYLVWTLWWIDVFFSLASCIGMPVIMIHYHKHSLEKMLATWLLPIVPAVVTPSVGAIVATTLPTNYAITTIFVSYFLWAIGIGVSFLIMACYLHRLFLHHIPDASMIGSAFLPMGPLGLGAFGFIHLAEVGKEPLSEVVAPHFADTIYFVSVLVGFMLWSFGTWWLMIALIFLLHRIKDMHFNISWWGLVFPFGAYTAGTLILGDATQFRFFKVLATIQVILLFIVWIFVLTNTMLHTISKELFNAPSITPLLMSSVNPVELGLPQSIVSESKEGSAKESLGRDV